MSFLDVTCRRLVAQVPQHRPMPSASTGDHADVADVLTSRGRAVMASSPRTRRAAWRPNGKRANRCTVGDCNGAERARRVPAAVIGLKPFQDDQTTKAVPDEVAPLASVRVVRAKSISRRT